MSQYRRSRGTKVPVSRTRAQIAELLTRAGRRSGNRRKERPGGTS